MTHFKQDSYDALKYKSNLKNFKCNTRTSCRVRLLRKRLHVCIDRYRQIQCLYVPNAPFLIIYELLISVLYNPRSLVVKSYLDFSFTALSVQKKVKR